MQPKVTTNSDNSSGTEYKTWFWVATFLKVDENAQKFSEGLQYTRC